MGTENKSYDAIIIGSGFGGSMTAQGLVNSGMKVLMIERGDWVSRGPENWEPQGTIDLTPHYAQDSPIRVEAGGNKKVMGIYSCVGGPSVFYGGVSFRFREEDFSPSPEMIKASGAQWPLTYRDLEPFYTQAEQLLKVSGETGVDPTEPYRSQALPQNPPELAGVSKKIKSAAEKLGLKPFQLPLAINYQDNHRSVCANCTSCDTFACAISAKNDLATVILPKLIEQGLDLRPNMVTVRLHAKHKELVSVESICKKTGATKIFTGKNIILSAGSLCSPQLLLASGLDSLNPGGKNVGRYLMRHVNAIVFGIYGGVPDKEKRFHKQLGIFDYYFGHPDIKSPQGKLGSLQQMPTPPAALVERALPRPLGRLISPGVKLLTGLLAIAEDQPQFSNYLKIDGNKKDKYGIPQPVVSHHYSKRDMLALSGLTKQAKKILRISGAIAHYVHHIRTFSHAVGTVRMGKNPETSVLDENCNFRGIDNLYVVDGSFMPTSSAVNPSLTISANALRVAKHIVEKW